MSTKLVNILSPSAFPYIDGSVQLPTYDRSKLELGCAHIGVGAFHRCHQAEYFDDAAEAGSGTGLVGINLTPPEIQSVLGPQDGLYSRTLAQGDDRQTRIIGVVRDALDYSNSPKKCRDLIASKSISTVTMTVTEKGYCHVPSTGFLDETHAEIAREIDNELQTTTTMPGFIVAALMQRRANDAGAINLISCDNIARNGKVLSNVVRGLSAQLDSGLERWIGENVAFPSTMVDRIVPASTESDRSRVEKLLGVKDAGAVLGEPFRQWVIEKQFTAKPPNLEVAGVEFVDDVADHEHIKMRVLNAIQTTLALLGALRGIDDTADAIREPDLAFFVTEMILRETIPNLPVVSGMEAQAYLQKSLERVGNRALRHRCHQISTDTSQKIRQRLLDPLRDMQKRSGAAHGLETAVAAWIAYLAGASAAFGARWTVTDPAMTGLEKASQISGGNIRRFAREIVGTESVFGRDLSRDEGFLSRISDRTERLMDGQPPAVVAGYKA